jgi:hypothetical protein
MNGTRSTDFNDWKCRRAEIFAQIQQYEIGPKPEDVSVAAAYANGVLNVVVTRTNGRALTLNCQVAVPSGPSPLPNGLYPAIIGMALAPGGGTGSLPSDIFSNCLQITYLHNQVTVYAAGQQIAHTNDPFYLMYPELNDSNSGQYAAWAWGVSRVIDGLFQVSTQLANSLPIDLQHIAVTGCSYAGKMALFSGAMDERVALTIPQESGGGGCNSWRYNYAVEPGGSVEDIDDTDYSWFADQLRNVFGGANVFRLPEDHHELMAMCLPRALYCTANPDYTWLGNPSHYVCGMACKRIYDTFGIGDRFGFSVLGGHSHCTFPDGQRSELLYFVNKFLYGQTNLSQVITTHPADYDSTIDYEAWSHWWGTTNPVFPVVNSTVTLTFEPECATVGTNWLVLSDTNASNGKYVTVTPGVQSLNSAPTNAAADLIVIPFTLTNSLTYHIFARVNDPTANDDSYWLQVDNGGWTMLNGLVTTGWDWVNFGTYTLAAGPHTVYIGYREDGAELDKISISDYPFAPKGLGQPAANLCGP